MTTMLPAAALCLAVWTASDTTVAARPGDRLVVEHPSGAVSVAGWGRDEVSVENADGRGRGPGIRRSGSTLSVTTPAGRSGRLASDVRIRVPAWMAIDLRGRDGDVRVEGTAGPVRVRAVRGDVHARDVEGDVDLTSVAGEVRVERARGRVIARSRADDVTVLDATGELVEVEVARGDVRLEGVDAGRVRAETLDGDVVFSGVPRPGGTYELAVHDGDATIAISPDSDVDVTVSTFSGEFVSDFPVTVRGYGGGGTFRFRLGSGGARLEVRVFSGEIRLTDGRPGAGGPRPEP